MSRTPASRPLEGALIAFDLDGTLVDTAPDLIGALNVVLVEQGLAPRPVAAARHLVGRGGRVLIADGFRAAGREVDPTQGEVHFRRFLQAYRERIAEHSRPYPNAVAMLDALDAAGATSVVCTNKPGDYARLLLRDLNLLDRFKAVVGADDAPAAKPDPRHLLHAIAQGGGRPDRAVMVGDSSADVGAAKAAGAPVIVVSFGYTATPPAELGGDILIDDLAEVPAACETLLDTALPRPAPQRIGTPS